MAEKTDRALRAYEALKWEIVTGQRKPGDSFDRENICRADRHESDTGS